MTRKDIEGAVKAFNRGASIRIKGYTSSSGGKYDYTIHRQPKGYYTGLVRVSLAQMSAPGVKARLLAFVSMDLPPEDVNDRAFQKEFDAAYAELLASFKASLASPTERKSSIVLNDDGFFIDPREDQASDYAAIYVHPVVTRRDRVTKADSPKKPAAKLKTRIKNSLKKRLPVSSYVPMLKLSANKLDDIEVV